MRMIYYGLGMRLKEVVFEKWGNWGLWTYELHLSFEKRLKKGDM